MCLFVLIKPNLSLWKIAIWMSKIAKNLTLKKKLTKIVIFSNKIANVLTVKWQFSGRSDLRLALSCEMFKSVLLTIYTKWSGYSNVFTYILFSYSASLSTRHFFCALCFNITISFAKLSTFVFWFLINVIFYILISNILLNFKSDD